MIKHLHFLFASIMMLAFGTSASAQNVVKFTFNEANSYEQFGLKGWSKIQENNLDATDGDIEADKTITSGDVTFTVTASAGNTPTRMFQDYLGKYSLRTYGGTKVIISSTKNIAKIEFGASKFNFTPEAGTLTEKIWAPEGDMTTATFNCSKSSSIETVTVTLSEGGNVEPTPGEATEIYSIVFDTKDKLDLWTKEGGMAKYKDFATFDENKVCVALNQFLDNGTTYFISPAMTLGEGNNTVSFENTQAMFPNDDAAAYTDLVIRTTDGAAWEKIEGAKFGNNWKEFISSGDLAVPAKYNGKEVQFAFECRFSQADQGSGYLYLKNFKVMGTKAATPDPEPTETIAENIAAFNALCTKDGVDVTLKLTDAKVLYVNEWTSKGKNNQEVYVKDATGNLMFYNAGLTVKNGDVLNGSIKGVAKDFYGTKEFCTNANTDATTLTATEGEVAEGDVKALNEINNDEISNLVVIKNVKMISREEKNNKGKVVTNYYVVDENNNELRFYNKFHINGLDANDFVDQSGLNFKGIIKLDFGALTLCPIEKLVNTGIDCIENIVLDINAPMYNIEGQKVNANYKGIVLQNGKKFFNK